MICPSENPILQTSKMMLVIRMGFDLVLGRWLHDVNASKFVYQGIELALFAHHEGFLKNSIYLQEQQIKQHIEKHGITDRYDDWFDPK